MILHLALFAALLGAAQAPEPTPNESLFRALQRADTAEVERLLRNGVTPNAVNADGDSALMVATLFADVNSMEILLRHGADPELANSIGATPLMWAIPDPGKIRLLIDHGADVNARTSTLQRTPFPDRLQLPGFGRGAGPAPRSWCRHPRHGCGRRGCPAPGDSIRRRRSRAVSRRERDRPERKQVSLNRHHLPSIDYLMSAGLKVDENSLVGATNWQDPALIESWVEMGANVNARSANYGKTSLMVAAASELAGPETLKLLLERGADPNAESTEGETAIGLGDLQGRPGEDGGAGTARCEAGQRPARTDLCRPGRHR